MRIKEYLLFSILAVFIAWSQFILLKPHLQYGFSDVDWGFLSIYKTENPYSPSQFIEFLKRGGTLGGVYTHQIYYIGIQNDLFGLNFKSFQITTHVFKILAILASIPFFWAISGSILITFISTILFAFASSAVGTIYTVVTSSDYSAIFTAGIFIVGYWYVIKNKIGNWLILTLLFFLLVLTLFLSTERMYPLPLFISLTEIFLWFKKGKIEKTAIRRMLVLLLPPFLIFLATPTIFLSFVSNHGVEIIQRISAGNWNLLLTPVIALGSIIIPHDYTKFLGTAKMDNFGSFLEFLITGPLLILVVITLVIGKLVFKKSHTAILQIFGLMILCSILLYILGSHFVDHQISIEAIVQALVGLYILTLSIVSLLYWLKYRERLLVGLFIGPFLAFLYIFFTWVGAATSEVFTGIHRYLTIPALFIDLFLGTLFTVIFINISDLLKKTTPFRIFAFTVFIPLLFFVYLNVQEIKAFFDYQLESGFGAAEKNLMRNQLNDYLAELSKKEPALFYFDFMEDNDRGYYYDNALLAGFESWMLWHPSINFNKELAPKVFWNNPQVLKASVQTKNGEKVIILEKRIYKINDFYAFKLNDKKVIDIKEAVLK